MNESLRGAALAWMGEVASVAHARKPHMQPYDVTTFDGCTAIPDAFLACCAAHDISYAFVETADERRRADVGFRDCIIAKTEIEGPLWRWLWRVLAWVAYIGVRIFGRGVVSRKRRRDRR